MDLDDFPRRRAQALSIRLDELVVNPSLAHLVDFYLDQYVEARRQSPFTIRPLSNP